MTDKPRLFYNSSPCCKRLMELITEELLIDIIIYHNVDDPQVQSRLPESFTRVPILIVKGISFPLIGREVFNWIHSRKYLNLTSIDINKSENPEFKETPHIGKNYNTNCAAIRDEDDKKMNSTLAYLEDWEKLRITSDMNKKFTDDKLSTETSQKKLEELVSSRSKDLEKIMNENKNF